MLLGFGPLVGDLHCVWSSGNTGPDVQKFLGQSRETNMKGYRTRDGHFVYIYESQTMISRSIHKASREGGVLPTMASVTGPMAAAVLRIISGGSSKFAP